MDTREHHLERTASATRADHERHRDWRWQWRQRIEGIDGLCRLLEAHGRPFDRQALARVVARYRFCIVPYVRDLINWQDPDDPIARQCLPDPREMDDDPGGRPDPYREQSQTPVPGLLHRFPDRALIMAHTRCPVACRHCTRKNTLDRPAMQSSNGANGTAALDYLADHPEIREVLISGGEPLLLETSALDTLLSAVRGIAHIEVVRIASRAPAMLPMRITRELVRMLRRHAPLWFNTQFNHPRELTPEALAACARLVDAGIPVSNQTVLLRGVNDRIDVLRDLCCRLQNARVRPYYVFLCDPITGIPHLRVPRQTAARLARQLRRNVGGLCLPRFVEDIPGPEGKREING